MFGKTVVKSPYSTRRFFFGRVGLNNVVYFAKGIFEIVFTLIKILHFFKCVCIIIR